MTAKVNGECRSASSGKGRRMGLFGWFKGRKKRNTEHVTYVPSRMYGEMTDNSVRSRPSPSLTESARRAESTVRRVPPPSSPIRSAGRSSSDSVIWQTTYGSSDSSSPGCSSSYGSSDSGSSSSGGSSSSDSGSSSCDSGGF